MEPNSNERFIADLTLERQAFKEFCELLQTEQETLLKGDVDRLVTLAQVKSDKVVSLNRMAENRSRYLASQSYSANQHGMDDWLKARPGRVSQVGDTWHELLELVKQAQQLNQSNGILIQQKLRHNQQALVVLQAAANQASLYGPDGQTQTARTSRPLGKV